jgi:hypothetical protein
MTTRTYTDQWVQMVIAAFGGVDNAGQHLKAVLLGNELDANGPPPGDPSFLAYYQSWIPQSFDNLAASLSAAGLDGIPVSTTIANYPMGFPPPAPPPPNVNLVAQAITKYITDHWHPGWNQGKPFVMYNNIRWMAARAPTLVPWRPISKIWSRFSITHRRYS